MSEDKRQDDLSKSKKTDDMLILPDEGREKLFCEAEQLHTESSPPRFDLRKWIQSNSKKVIAAGLALILLAGALALGKHPRVEPSQGRRHELHKQPLERKVVQKETLGKPEESVPDTEQKKPKAGTKQVVIRLLSKEEVKAIVEKELDTSFEKMTLKNMELIRNPVVKRYSKVTPGEHEIEENKEVEKTVKDKLFYKVEVEINGKKEELKIGAETGEVYYSTAKNKA